MIREYQIKKINKKSIVVSWIVVLFAFTLNVNENELFYLNQNNDLLILSADTEPNDDENNANILSEGVTYGNVSDTDTWDYYKIYLYENDDFSLTYTLLTSGLGYQNPRFRFSDPSDWEIINSNQPTETLLLPEVYEEGWWNLSVQSNGGGVKNYSLDCTLISVNDPPSTPLLSTISPNPDYDGHIYLSWTASDSVDGYYVYRSTETIIESPTLAPIATTTGTTYLDTHLADDAYYYAIIGYRGGLNSSLSNNQQVTVQLATPKPEYLVGEIDYSGYVLEAPSFITADLVGSPISLPFDFPFYDQSFSTLYLSTDGWISFDNTDPDETAGPPFPTDEIAYNCSIAPFMSPNSYVDNDFRLYNGSNYWAIYWENCDNVYTSTGWNDFSLVLFRTGEILFEYTDLDKDFEDYLIGLNYGDGVTGITIENSDLAWAEKAFLFEPPQSHEPLPPVLGEISNDPDFDGLIDLSWEPLLLEAEKYYLFRSDAEISDITGLLPIYEGPALSFQDEISTNDQYFYCVIAENSTYNSTLSNVVNVTVALQNPVAPNVHEFIPDTSNSGVVNLSWDATGDTDGYYIFRELTNITSITGLSPIAYTPETYYDEIIRANGKYYYAIVASNEWGNSSISNCVAITISYMTPDIPVLLEFPLEISHTGNFTVHWEESDNVIYYLLYRDNQIITEVGSLIPIANITGTSFEERNLPNGEYFYSAIASNYIMDSDLATNINITVEILSEYNYSDQIAYRWIESSIETQVTLSNGDDGYGVEELQFNFTLYDKYFDTVYIGTNGWISFINNDPTEYVNLGFPLLSLGYAYSIAGFWDDLVVGSNVSVISYPNCFVISYNNVSRYGFEQNIYLGSFQIVLFSTGEILLQYQNIDYVAGGYTAGLNLGDGELGLMYPFITGETEDLAIMFSFGGTGAPIQPELAKPLDSPTFQPSIELEWEPSAFADNYSVYRTTEEVQSLADLTGVDPVYTGVALSYSDTVGVSDVYYYTIIAENIYGQSAVTMCHEVDVTLTPPATPTIGSLTMNNVTHVFNITWDAVDYAEKYYIVMDLVELDEVKPTSIIFETATTTKIIPYYLNDTYYFALIASNANGNSSLSAWLSINTTETQTEVPNLPPTVSNPADINITTSDLPYNISWTIEDETVLWGEYEVYINDTFKVDGTWESGVAVVYTLTDLQAGEYDIRIELTDGFNPSVSDTIHVIIEAESGPGPEPGPNNLGLMIGIAGGVAVAGTVTGLFIRKRKSKRGTDEITGKITREIE